MKKTFKKIEASSGFKEITTYEFDTLGEVDKKMRSRLSFGDDKYDIAHYTAKIIKNNCSRDFFR